MSSASMPNSWLTLIWALAQIMSLKMPESIGFLGFLAEMAGSAVYNVLQISARLLDRVECNVKME